MNTPALIRYEVWVNSQLSIAKYTGGIAINGTKYILMDSSEPAAEGRFKPDLVRTDWCSLYTKLHRGIEQYIEQGFTPAQVKKIIKEKNDLRGEVQ